MRALPTGASVLRHLNSTNNVIWTFFSTCFVFSQGRANPVGSSEQQKSLFACSKTCRQRRSVQRGRGFGSSFRAETQFASSQHHQQRHRQRIAEEILIRGNHFYSITFTTTTTTTTLLLFLFLHHIYILCRKKQDWGLSNTETGGGGGGLLCSVFSRAFSPLRKLHLNKHWRTHRADPWLVFRKVCMSISEEERGFPGFSLFPCFSAPSLSILISK